MLLWKHVYGFTSVSVAQKMDAAMLDWIHEMTKCLRIWYEKGVLMSDGKLILARVNMGALVESWLKFFYCVYYDDYLNAPKTDKKGKVMSQMI